MGSTRKEIVIKQEEYFPVIIEKENYTIDFLQGRADRKYQDKISFNTSSTRPLIKAIHSDEDVSELAKYFTDKAKWLKIRDCDHEFRVLAVHRLEGIKTCIDCQRTESEIIRLEKEFKGE